LNYKFEETNDNYYVGSSNWFIKTKSSEDNTIELIYNLGSYEYPKSKKLNIKFNKLYLTKNEISENEEIGLNGEWNLSVDVPKEMYDREAVIYNVKSCSDSSINITKAIVYNTGMRFEFTTNFKPISEKTDSEETRSKKLNEFLEWKKTQFMKYNKNIINDIFVEDSKGKRYMPLNSSSEDAKYSYLVDGSFEGRQTFSLTKYDITDKLTIHFNINIPSENKDVIIELERK